MSRIWKRVPVVQGALFDDGGSIAPGMLTITAHAKNRGPVAIEHDGETHYLSPGEWCSIDCDDPSDLEGQCDTEGDCVVIDDHEAAPVEYSMIHGEAGPEDDDDDADDFDDAEGDDDADE